LIGTGFNTIYTPSDNRVLTATGSSANQARANSNFTFDYSTSPNRAKVIGHLIVGNITPTSYISGRIDASDDVIAFSTSDERLKENIIEIDKPLEKLESLRGVYFDWKESMVDIHGYEGRDVGVIAQEIETVLGEAIRTNDNGYLSVRYEKIIPLLIEAIKELNRRISDR
jgi:hypothetical protein